MTAKIEFGEAMTTTKFTLKIYWNHAKKYKSKLLTLYPLMVIAQLAEDVAAPIIVSGILTKLAQNNTQDLALSKIWPLLLLITALELTGHLLWNVVVRLFWRTQDAIMRDLSLTVYKHLTDMSYRFYSERFAGSLVSQTNKFVGSFERLTDPLTWNVFKLIIAFISTSVILAPKAPSVVIAMLVITAVYIPVVWNFRKKQIPYNKRWASAETRRTGQLADGFSNIMAIKSFANERFEEKRMEERSHEVHERSMDTMKINMSQELVSGALQRSINISVIIVSVLLAVNGKLQVGTIYLALTFTTAILRRLWDLNNTFRQFTRVFGDAGDMAEILQITPEIADPVNPVKFRAKDGSISFKDVTFWYPDRSKSDILFDNVSFNIKKGEHVGLVGPSGGGKTTITKLLLRFMDIQDGTIAIDDQDITKITQADLRRSITYVPQEPLLFHRSISENIAYGNNFASKELVEAAAKKAHAHDFIMKLSDGYDTLVGERGVKLSGGQKQRIAIARSLIKNAPILLLDEATSALDSESEALIQDALWKLMQNKTAIVIAHRLSTIQKMDRIIVLDDGKIAEEGSHAELIKNKKGLYSKLWAHQSGGFLQD